MELHKWFKTYTAAMLCNMTIRLGHDRFESLPCTWISRLGNCASETKCNPTLLRTLMINIPPHDPCRT